MTRRRSIADRIRSEALIADRPGQLARLQQIAGEVDLTERKPMTRQRSRWERFDGMGAVPGAKSSQWWQRNVADGRLVACVADEPLGWHLSISFRDHRNRQARYPSWDEIAHARDELLPADVGFVMHLPAAGNYLAWNETFHLHEHPPRVQS